MFLTQLQQLFLCLLSVVQGLLKDAIGKAAGDGWRITIHRLSVPVRSTEIATYIQSTM